MTPFAANGRAISLLPFGIAGLVGRSIARSSELIRWPGAAERHKPEQERSRYLAGFNVRMSLILLRFFVSLGSAQDRATPPPLRFVRGKADPAQLLPARKMKRPLGGSGVRHVA